MAATTPLTDARSRIRIPDAEMLPLPSLFLHASRLHGQLHVARVLLHGLRLAAATDALEDAPRLWAAIYLHDIARTHDGREPEHGARAWARLAALPDVSALLARAGVEPADHAAITYAVTTHSCGEPSPTHPHYRLAALLKDADALDRVRLNDLKIRMLRHKEARPMVPFAQRLLDETDGVLTPGPDLFARVWEMGLRLLSG